MSSCYYQIQSRIEIAMFDLLPNFRLWPLSEGKSPHFLPLLQIIPIFATTFLIH